MNYPNIQFESVSANPKRITAQVKIDPDSPFFDGHFPGYPLLPGIAQILFISRLLTKYFKKTTWLNSMNRVKFTAPVKPGALLDIRIDLKPDQRGTWLITCGRVSTSRGNFSYIHD